MFNIYKNSNNSYSYNNIDKPAISTTAQNNEDIIISFENGRQTNDIDEPNSFIKSIFGLSKNDEDNITEDDCSDNKKGNYTIKELEEELNEELLPESKSAILSRELLSLKNKNGDLYTPEEILAFSLFDDIQWSRVKNRDLLNTGLTTTEILAYANLDDEKWQIAKNRKLLEANKIYPDLNFQDISNLIKIEDEDWKNRDIINKFCNRARIPIPIDTFRMLSLLTQDEWNNNKDTISKIDSKGYVEELPFSFHYEKIKGYNPKLSTLKSYNKKDEKVVISNLERIVYRKDFDIANERLYGKRNPLAAKALSDFEKLYPDIDLRIDNNASCEKTVEIINNVREYIDSHKKADIPFSKTIIFTKIGGAAGVSNMTTASKYGLEIFPRICVNIDSSDNHQKIILAHENCHYRDKFRQKNAKVPQNIIDIMKNGLDNYAITNEAELVAILTEAIETPEDRDYNPWTIIMHVRQDKDGNSFLMLPKEYKDVNIFELNELGEYLKSIDIPPIMPDYDERMHGSLEYYNEVLIREAK